MEVIIFIGIQASGKSAFHHRYFRDSHVRVNLDMLRTRRRESLLFNACLEGETRCVIDNTNVSRKSRERYILPARERDFPVMGYYFASGAAECLRRNAERRGTARIPDKGLLATYNRLEIPASEEGFDQLFYVRVASSSGNSSNSSCARDGEHEFLIEDWKNEV